MSDDVTAPKNPADYRPARSSGVGFWGIVALCVVCVLAGMAAATFAPRVLSPRPAPSPAPRPVEIVSAPAPALSASSPSVAPADLVAGERSADITRLGERLSALEGRERDSAASAAAALAAAALVESSQGSRPFSAELAVLRAAAPGAPELAALSRLAETGAPSRAALAASFPEYASQAAAVSRAPGEGARLGDRIRHTLSRIVAIRRVGDVPGDATDAQLARAERLVEDGDLDRALRALDQLPAPAREAVAPWRARAERRAEIDRAAAALRARALRDLTAPSRGGA